MRQPPTAVALLSLYGALTLVAAACGGSSAASSPQTSTAGSAAAQAGGAGAMSTAGGAGQTSQGGAGGTLATAGAVATTAGTAGSATVGAGGTGQTAGGASGAGGTTEPTRPFMLASPKVDEGGMIGLEFRCTGANVTPSFDWFPGPAGTQSYAITLIHVGSQSVHWVLWDIPATTLTLPEKIAREAMPATPAGSKQIKPNIDGATWYGYTGPCPGGADQSYTFSLYALDVATLPGITPESTSAAANTAVKAHQLAVSQITVKASK
jgi:Raf kinase inhibitor-like YbhB/YbcL family protein